MTPYMADVLVHAGIGSVFACTGACARYVCKHRIKQIAVGGAFVLAEAALMVQVVG